MKVYVKDIPIDLLSSMTVKHALIAVGLLKEIEPFKKVYDEWGNKLGLEGPYLRG